MRRSAAAGVVLWILVAVVALPGGGPFWILELLFLLAPLVLVPLARAIVDPQASGARRSLAAASAVVLSFLAPRGSIAAALVLPWLGVTLEVAWRGAVRWRVAARDAAEAAIIAGHLFLPVGGAWLVLSRAGATPMGFEEPIVLLTAVHFHFAAFTTLVLVGCAGRALGAGRARGYQALSASAMAGVPLLAAGITFSRGFELLGAAMLAVALWSLAIVGLRRVVRLPSSLASRVLLSISYVSLVPSMALALAYSWGRATGRPVVALADLVAVHAPLNAFGFALCGLLGWAASPSPPAPVHGG